MHRHKLLDPLWHVHVFIVLTVAMQLLLPSNLVRGPRILIAALELILMAGMTLATPRAKIFTSSVRRSLVVSMIVLISIANVTSLELLIRVILHGDALDGTRLILSGVNVSITNIVIFALWYWEMDGGGPGVRMDNTIPYRDFKFTQMDSSPYVPKDWFPTFIDYLYLSATNALAFSPTDTLPLTRRAKMLMLLQSLVSISTIALVVARAVNVLGR